jgi:large repetitive protein
MSRSGIRHGHGPRLRRFAAVGAATCLISAGTGAWLPGVARGQASPRAFTVNSTADAHDAHPGDGKCADAAGRCTLRAALEEAAASPAGSKVHVRVPAGTYDLALGSLTLGSASVPLRITVAGAAPSATVVAARGRFRVLAVTAGTTGLLKKLEITGGKAGPNSYGGGIYSQGKLTLSRDSLIGNAAGAGGGVANAGGTLTVAHSMIENNDGGGFGGGGIQNGGPENVPGTVVVRSSTISGNVTSNEGGAIFSGQNGHPAGAGQAAVAPRRLCAPARCPAPRFGAAVRLVLQVTGSEITGNRGGNGGGGIAAAQGTATLAGSTVTANTAGAAIGGGVFDVGTVTRSTISGNTAVIGGGAEDFPGLVMRITNSTISGNHALADGGGLDVTQQIDVVKSTLAGNRAGGPFLGMGAAAEINGAATLVISDSTVAGSTTRPANRGAIDNFGGSLILSFATLSGSQGLITGGGFYSATGTILAGTGATPNCRVSLSETAGYNLSTDSSCGLSLKTDLIGVNPMLRPLARNGGPTMTQALPRSSPAVNAGGLPAASSCPATDQRGASRPWGPACDIGAFELHYHL